jgi:hypothetical protein
MGMTPDDSSGRVRGGDLVSGFSEREMKLIFERAGDAGAEADDDRRYSLAEIQAIAIQAGLDPHDIARAAATVRAAPAGHPVFGAPIRFRASRVIPGELTEPDILDVVLRIRERTGLHGELRAVPGGMEWRARSSMGQMIVDFARTANGTRVDVLVAREDQAALTIMGGIFAGIAAGVALAVGTAGALHVGPAVAVGAVGAISGSWASTRLMWSRIARRWSRTANDLAETIADTVDKKP